MEILETQIKKAHSKKKKCIVRYNFQWKDRSMERILTGKIISFDDKNILFRDKFEMEILIRKEDIKSIVFGVD